LKRTSDRNFSSELFLRTCRCYELLLYGTHAQFIIKRPGVQLLVSNNALITVSDFDAGLGPPRAVFYLFFIFFKLFAHIRLVPAARGIRFLCATGAACTPSVQPNDGRNGRLSKAQDQRKPPRSVLPGRRVDACAIFSKRSCPPRRQRTRCTRVAPVAVMGNVTMRSSWRRQTEKKKNTR
jgi:hypothetical protein